VRTAKGWCFTSRTNTEIVCQVPANAEVGTYKIVMEDPDRNNYGPIWIPAKGATITLTEDNLPIYERCIVAYEGNKLEVKPDGIYINGEKTNEYTFKMDYYWMMGDNRHNSADSRYWGFVPEDHVVGKPIVVWLSLDKDRGWFDGKIRWNRLFKWVD
jgi:signal peptidase I